MKFPVEGENFILKLKGSLTVRANTASFITFVPSVSVITPWMGIKYWPIAALWSAEKVTEVWQLSVQVNDDWFVWKLTVTPAGR